MSPQHECVNDRLARANDVKTRSVGEQRLDPVLLDEFFVVRGVRLDQHRRLGPSFHCIGVRLFCRPALPSTSGRPSISRIPISSP